MRSRNGYEEFVCLRSNLSCDSRRIETPSHDALFRTILSLNFYHVILYFYTTPMVAVSWS